MDALFLKLLNLSITASWIVLAIVLVRLLIKKAPKFISCLLWVIVAVRLVCPFSFESVLSLVPSTQTIPETAITDTHFNVDSGVSVIDNSINPILDNRYPEDITASASTANIVLSVLGAVWLAGMIIMLLYMLLSFLKVRKQVSAKIRLRDNIFICDEVKSPFIMGILRPQIYLPSDLDGEQRDYVLSHELAHLKRHDNLWKPLGFIILSVYWFNPVMWLAYILLCRDIEAACDEKVIREMTDDDRAGYSQALLDCGTNKKSIQVCPVAFGETGVKERVKNVLNYKKPAFWIIIIAVIVSIIVAVCFLTNPKKDEDFYDKANMKITENLPPVLEISPYTNYLYKEVNYGILFEEDFTEVRVSYNDDEFYDAKKQIEDTISFRGDTLLDSFGETVFDSISTDISDYNFRIAALAESVYPKNFWIIGMNEKDREIIYIHVDAQDLDRVDNLEDFLCKEAKIEKLIRQNFSKDSFLFNNIKRGSIPMTYVWQGAKQEPMNPQFTLNPNNRTVTFTSSALSSYFGKGKYTYDGNKITIKSDDGKYILTFTKYDDSYILNSKESFYNHKELEETKPAKYYEFYNIPDGAEFIPEPLDLDETVGQVILAENADKDWRGECYTEGHVIFGHEDSGSKTKIYTLTEFSSFGFENGYFVDVGGNCVPAVITVDRSTGAYSIRYAEDGEYYPKSIKKMFPVKYQSRAFGDNAKDGESMWNQCVAQAEEYLESIGRKAEVKSWGDIQHTIFTDIGMPVDISNRLEDYIKTYNYYDYLGYEEIIEGGVRYIYRTSYLTDKDTLLFSKEIYGKNQIVNLIQMNIETGEIISMANAPDGNADNQSVGNFIDAEVVSFKNNILTVKSNKDGTQYKIDTAPLNEKLKPDGFYDGLYLRIYYMGNNTETNTLANVFLIAVLGDVAEYGGVDTSQVKVYTTVSK